MRRCAVFLVCCTSLACAVEAPPVAKPFVEIVIPSGSQLIARGAASVLGKAWKDPGVAALRTRADRELSALHERFGIDFWQVLEQGRNLRFSMHLKSGTVRDTPGFSAQVDLGGQAAAVFEHLAKEGVAEALPDADAAVTVTWAGTEVHVQRRGTWLLASSEAAGAGPGVAVEPGHDLSVHVDGPLLLESMLAEGRSDMLAGEPLLRRLLIDNDNDQKLPKDFTELIDTSGGDLTAKSLRHPAHPERNDAYLYVRAWPGAKSTQPLIVEDPAVWNGEGCWVGYCDGHLSWIERAAATKIWAHAKTLAGSPTAQGDGLKAQDWAPVQALLDQQPE